MPIIDLGYRSWDGERSSRWLRPIAITATGLAMVWRASWLRRLFMIALLPSLPVVLGFFLYEQARFQESLQEFVLREFAEARVSDQWGEALRGDTPEARHMFWALSMQAFFRYPQALLMVVLFGLVAPRLISFDLRSRAYLLYFSRPLSVAEYLIGKALVLVVLLLFTSTIPALLVYLAGLAFSPDLWTFTVTWDIPLRILVASVTLAVPTAALAILYSSFTSESRYASFAWFATWGLGWVTYLVMNSTALFNNQVIVLPRYLSLISPYHTLGQVQAVVFGTLENPAEARDAMVLVAVVTVCAIVVSYHRVAGQLRI